MTRTKGRTRSTALALGALACSAAALLGLQASGAKGASSQINWAQTMAEPVDIFLPTDYVAERESEYLFVANRCSKTVTEIRVGFRDGDPSILGKLLVPPLGVTSDWGTTGEPDNGWHVYAMGQDDQLWRYLWPFDQEIFKAFARIGSKPSDIAIDPAGNVYTSSEGERNVTRTTPSGGRGNMGSLGSPPEGVAVDAAGNMFTTEWNYSVARISPLGITDFIGKSDSSARRIALDSSGNIYVVNSDRDTVSKITQGREKTTFAYTGPGSRPFDLAFDRAGNLYTANVGNNTVSKTTPDGRTTREWAKTGDRPVAIAVDRSRSGKGNVYTVNFAGRSVTRITPGPSGPTGNSSTTGQRQETVRGPKGSGCGPKLNRVRAVVKPREVEVVSRVSVNQAGRLSQRVFSTSGKRKEWCTTRRTVKSGQTIRLRCDLGNKGRRAVARRSLRLAVRTTLVPETAPPGSTTVRRIEIARQR